SLLPALSARAPEFPVIRADQARGFIYFAYAPQEDVSGNLNSTITFFRSADGGATWSAPVALSGPKCVGTRMAVGPDGELYVVWEDFSTSQALGRKSVNFGNTFGPVFTVADMLDNLGMPPPGWTPDHNRVNPVYYQNGHDLESTFPSIAVDGSSGLRRGAVYVTWAERGQGTIVPATQTVFEREPNDFWANATEIAVGQEMAGF